MVKPLYIILLVLSSLSLKAQSLRIKDFDTGKDITGDTIVLELIDNGFRGWQSLNLELKVVNTGLHDITTGAKKIEYDAFKDASHSFCFAGNCYDERTFISPSNDKLKPGETDVTFSAHLIFNDTVHKPGINHAAYVFYDINNPSDSAVIFVIYNTNKRTGIEPLSQKGRVSFYPNPSKDYVTISGLDQKAWITIAEIGGKEVYTGVTGPADNYKISVIGLKNGIYFLKCRTVNETFFSKLLIQR